MVKAPRIYIDSVWDSDIVVLISTDGKTEKAVNFEKDALFELLKGRRGFFESYRIRRNGQYFEGIKLKRRIEGKVAVFSKENKPFFEDIVKRFQYLTTGIYSIVKKSDVEGKLK